MLIFPSSVLFLFWCLISYKCLCYVCFSVNKNKVMLTFPTLILLFFWLPPYLPTCLSFGQGVYYQIGDVIKVIDEEDGKPYYAQIRGFVQDQYCEKSAALTWLIPTQTSPRDQFDPSTYIVGEFPVVSCWQMCCI